MIADIQKRNHAYTQDLILSTKIQNLAKDSNNLEGMKVDIASIFKHKNKDLIIFFIFGEIFRFDEILYRRNYCNILYLVSVKSKENGNFETDFVQELRNNGIGFFEKENLVIKPILFEIKNEIKEAIIDIISAKKSETSYTKETNKKISTTAREQNGHLFEGIVVDGSNVALDGKNEKNRKVDIDCLEKLYNQLIDEYSFSGDFIEIFVRPDLKYQADDFTKRARPPSKKLQRLMDMGIVEETPIQNKNLPHTDEDDYFIINEAIQSDYFILSNDFFRNWRKRDSILDEEIELRRVTYKWIKKAKKFTFNSKLRKLKS